MAKSKKSIFEYLLEAAGIKQNRNESDEKFKQRLLSAVDDLEDDVFEKLPNEAQEFYMKALRAWNGEDGHKEGTLLAFPGFDDAEPASKEEPAPKRGRAAKPEPDPEEDAGEEADEEQEAEEAEEAEADPEEETQPKRGRERLREKEPVAAKSKANGKSAPAKGAKETAKPGRPALRQSKAEEAKPAAKAKAPPKAARKPREINRTGSIWAIKEELIKDPSASTSDILDRLTKRKIETKESTVTGIRSDFLHSLHVLQDKGLLSDKLARALPG